MHDTQLEDNLRNVLREEGDRLPFHVDVGRLEAELRHRRRARSGRRLGLVAAAVAMVAVGTAFAISGGFLGQAAVGTHPSPTPSPDGTLPPDVPDVLRLLEVPRGHVEFDALSERTEPDQDPSGTRVVLDIGDFPAAPQVGYALVCVGPGGAELRIGQPGNAMSAWVDPIPCDGKADVGYTNFDPEQDHHVALAIDERAIWRIIGTSEGDLSGVVLDTDLRGRNHPPDGETPDSVEARVACARRFLDGAQPRVEECARADWPDMADERSVEIAGGEALWLALDFGWQMEDVSISAAPLGDTGAGIPATRVNVPVPGAAAGSPLRIPVRDHLAPGSWVVAVTFVARHDVADDVEPLPEPFEAAMFLRVEILP
jgi:hypothetical protein